MAALSADFFVPNASFGIVSKAFDAVIKAEDENVDKTGRNARSSLPAGTLKAAFQRG